ncbi:MAG: DNA mismatch repair endonuclease MutL [Muribaculaceae bacterium]|nr:DNA mismatch repair endonuclease MutL [Roseburia sp.]MCM1430955.1 DNA mismatch repair endonuclease MutL [Muribaculaceae bacterium]MCM1493903.1 DNA mismatch repair endonuclease MutL [Muribaculaceae bacterium]
MGSINMLSQETIDKIAAGEVVERPRSVVKELVENAIDAGATAITVEIKEGGLSFIRITDNGSGIAKEEVALAFLRHSTSKIKSAEDLLDVRSLGFRGEALSSIAAVSRVELITKTGHALTGTRYLIEGSKEISLEDVGAPDGTTFLVKDLFYNTPARRKFLKTPQTEGTYISDLIEKLALSHPEISFKFINNNQTKLHTSGNGNRRDLIYHIYGRDITAELLSVDYGGAYFQLSGFIGKPSVNRGNRNFENYFINGRYIKSNLLSKAIEEAYKSFLMQHQYPFTVLYFDFTGETLDVNVHPTKMELRFGHNQEIYQELADALYAVLSHRELIPEVPVTEEKAKAKIVHEYREPIPEPFEKRRLNDLRQFSRREETPDRDLSVQEERGGYHAGRPQVHILGGDRLSAASVKETQENAPEQVAQENVHEQMAPENAPEQVTLESMAPDFLTEDARKKHRIIGQLFQTYWLLEYEDKLYIIDQHAAHEKVLYERTMKTLKDKEFTSQAISPPIVLSLDAKEQESLENCRSQLERLGYAVESFGGREYMISAVPANLFSIDVKELFIEMLDDFSSLSGRQTPELILEKVASMSCKAAVKGNHTLSLAEIDALMGELLTLENPFNCPHGRPTIISMSKYELEKKFKRIV